MDTMPAEIHLEPFSNAMMGRQEAKITLRFRSNLPRATSEREGELEAQTRVLEHNEGEACLALCHAILYEHGGEVWSEQEGSISLALPLAKQQTNGNS